MGYYLQDNPNPNTAQFGWPRTRVSGVVGVHTAESGVYFDGPDPGAENTANFIRRRTDHGSYHALADADSLIKLVHPRYSAWADTTNNAHAMSVSGAMDAARWRDLSAARAAALTRNMAYAAAELVRDAIAAGLLTAPVPARRITPAEAIKGSRAGFYGHGETNPGRRYDPGQNFNWDLFLSTYAEAISGGIAAMGTTTTSEEDDVTAEQVWNHLIEDPNAPGRFYPAYEWLRQGNVKAGESRDAVKGLLNVRLPDPANPKNTYSLAEWIVYGNVKAGAAADSVGNLSPDVIAAAVTAAQAKASADAESKESK